MSLFYFNASICPPGKEDRVNFEVWMSALFADLKQTAEQGVHILDKHVSVNWYVITEL